MKYFKLTFVLCCGLLVLSACKKDKKSSNSSSTTAAKAIDYDAMAVDFCACMKPLVDLNNQIKNLMEAGETAKMQALFPQVEKMSAESETCIAKLESSYGTITAEQEKKAEAAMARKCPKVAEMVKAAEAMEK